jgi:hypothetical protein
MRAGTAVHQAWRPASRTSGFVFVVEQSFEALLEICLNVLRKPLESGLRPG